MSEQSSPERASLFDEFPTTTYDEWYEAAIAALKGASFEKKLVTPLYEGLVLQPIYRQEDAASIAHQHSVPGHYPFVRGARASGYLASPWQVAQALPLGTPEAFNKAMRDDLERGQTTINLPLDSPSRLGLDPDNLGLADVGRDGVSIACADDLWRALDGLPLDRAPLIIHAGVSSLAILGMLAVIAEERNIPLESLSGAVTADPLGMLAAEGALPLEVEMAYDHLAAATAWAAAHAPDLQTIGIDTSVYHNGGANAVQELVVALGTGVNYIRALVGRGLPVDMVVPRMRFTFAVGAQFFLEVAKLRAARMLWAQAVRAFGGDADSQKMRLHVTSGKYNKTIHAPYVNMLRTTIEAFVGAAGGADSMHVAPFDSVIRPPDDFSRRIARNQQLILQHEAQLTRIIDPAGGSWYVEALTDWLAREAWLQFQRIEASGGMLEMLEQGVPQMAIAGVAAQRAANISKRKYVIVGTNMYPNPDEARLVDTTDYGAIAHMRRIQIAAQRSSDRDLSALDDLSVDGGGVELVHDVIAAIKAGATLGEITTVLFDQGAEIEVLRVKAQRGADRYESLRDNARWYEDANGHPPRIFLANMGLPSQHQARADFTMGFFQVGGFEVTSPDGFQTPEEAATAANESGACAVVICSTDETYPEIVPPLVKAVKAEHPEMIVILAGHPEDQIEAHRHSGIDEFIHIRANCYEVNVWLQQQVGV